MSQVVKTVGSEYIYFEEYDIDNVKFIVAIISVLTVIIASLLCLCSYTLNSDSFIKDGTFIVCIMVSFVVALVMTGLFAQTAPKSWTTFPGYHVYISGHRECDVYIIKTSPEEDQIAICKAAKELEPKAKEFDDHEKELERIASKCK